MKRSRNCVFISVMTGCCLQGCYDYPGWQLDQVARSIDDYGTVTISGATLIEPDARFQLDLELTGAQIFERNRIEGFSNVSRHDATNVEISVKAEIISNLVDQMSATTDPGLLSKLRSNLMAAAFQTMVGDLPPELKPSESQPIETETADQEPEDGGLASAALATSALKDATAAKEKANAAWDEIKELDPTDATKEEAIREGTSKLLDHAKAMTAKADTGAKLIQQAGAEAKTLALKVQSVASGDLTKFGVAKTEAVAALGPAETAAAAAETLNAAIKKANNAVTATKPEKPTEIADVKTAAQTVAEAVADVVLSTSSTAEDAAKAARAAEQTLILLGGGSVAGKKKAKTKEQKIIEAPKIKIEDRLALAKMPAFADALANYEGETALNLRQLLVLTASDKMTLEMLRWLSYPRGYGPGKRVYLCMASVNVTPGRRTYAGYQGTVDLAMNYASGVTGQHELSRHTGRSPVAFAAFPFIDSQVLDLRTSQRRSFSMAVQLIINGYPAAGQALLEHASQKSQDVQTLTGINTVSSYSNGKHVGFTFSPRLVAQSDPSNWNSRPAMTLQPQTIPVVLLIVCEETTLEVLAKEGRQPYLQWDQTYFWRRTGDPIADYFPFGETVSKLLRPRLSEIDMGQRARALDKAQGTLDRWVYESAKASYEERLEDANQLYWNTIQEAETARNEAIAKGTPPSAADARLGEIQTHALETWQILVHEADGEFIPRLRGELIIDGSFGEQLLRQRIDAFKAAGIGHTMHFALPLFDATEMHTSSDAKLHARPLQGWVNRPSTFLISADADVFQHAKIGEAPGFTLTSAQLKKLKVTSTRIDFKPAKDGETIQLESKGFKTEMVDSISLSWQQNGIILETGKSKLNLYTGEYEITSSSGEISVTIDKMVFGTPSPVTAQRDAPSSDRASSYFVTIGGRAVNASRVSARVLKVTMPPWMDTFDFEEADKLRDQGSLSAQVIVTNGQHVYKCEEPISFEYYAPTPKTAGGKGTIVDPSLQTPTATFADAKPLLDASKPDKERTLNLKLSRPVKAKTGTLVLSSGECKWPLPVSVDGSQVKLTKPPAAQEFDGLPAEMVFPNKVKTIVLNLDFPNGDSIKLNVKAEFTIKTAPPSAKINADATIDSTKSDKQEIGLTLSRPVDAKKGTFELEIAYEKAGKPGTKKYKGDATVDDENATLELTLTPNEVTEIAGWTKLAVKRIAVTIVFEKKKCDSEPSMSVAVTGSLVIKK